MNLKDFFNRNKNLYSLKRTLLRHKLLQTKLQMDIPLEQFVTIDLINKTKIYTMKVKFL
jgi:hypothetical protein